MNDYSYEEIEPGFEQSFSVMITEKMMSDFFCITGDENPLHVDKDYAIEKGYASPVVYGMLTASFFSTLAGVYLPGKKSLIHSVTVDFSNPVYIGDVLTVIGTVIKKHDIYQTLSVKVSIRDQHQQLVCHGKIQVGFVK